MKRLILFLLIFNSVIIYSQTQNPTLSTMLTKEALNDLKQLKVYTLNQAKLTIPDSVYIIDLSNYKIRTI